MTEAKDTFTLSWCEKHKNWNQYNCADCMLDANEEEIKRKGIRKAVEWLNANTTFRYGIAISNDKWKAQLKEWFKDNPELLKQWGIEE